MYCGIHFLKSHGACIQTRVVCMKIPTHMMTLAKNKQMMGVGGWPPCRGCKGAVAPCLEKFVFHELKMYNFKLPFKSLPENSP